MSLPTAASVISSGLSASATVYYDRTALDTLYSNLYMYAACETKTMPNRNGVAMQIFDYTKLGSNTVAVTEGTPGSGQALTQNTRTINLANYADFLSFSNKVVLTGISDTLTEGAALLGYRGALSVDNVISTAVDTAANGDSNSRIEVADGSYLTAALIRKAAWQLRSVDARPKANGSYFGIAHSLAIYDLVNDSSSSGLTDLQKFSDSLATNNPALAGIKGSRVGIVGGVELYESNAVPTEPNWQSSAHTAYHTYVFGNQAFIASSLGNTDLNQKNFSVSIRNFDQGNSIDVAGLIKAAAIYNFFFGCVQTTGSTSKFRRVRSESSIG